MKFIIESIKRLVRGNQINAILLALCTVMTIYHFIYARVWLQGPVEHQNTHLFFALIIVFLGAWKSKPRIWPIFLALILLSIVSTGYVEVFYDDLEYRIGLPITADVVIGCLLIILCHVSTWISFGPVLPLVSISFLLYSFFGGYAPGRWAAMFAPFDVLISKLSMLSGIYGIILDISATYVFIFMIFAGLMEATGAVQFFVHLGRLIGRWFRAGPAMAAVITSGLLGSISGSAGANVAITGSFTIPAMKKAGFKPEYAGGVESAASTGGPIIPPVMGVAAFIMAGMTGVPYLRIISVAVLPAFLYVLACAFNVSLQAAKQRIVPQMEVLDVRELLVRTPQFIVPIIACIILFMQGKTPMTVAFFTCIILVVISIVPKRTRPSFTQFMDGITRGAILGARVGVVCALLGLVIKTVTLTGLGIRFPMLIGDFCGDNLFLLLIFTAMVSILLGCGLPSSAAYILVAIVLAPPLVKLGVPLLAAHFFAFFFACFSFITPPVAIAALYGSQIAGAGYIRTSVEAAKVGFAGFIIPFMMVLCPLFMLDYSNLLISLLMIIAIILALLCIHVGFVGYFLKDANLIQRVAAFLMAVLALAYVFTSHILFFAAGTGIFAVLTLWQVVERRGAAQKQI
jgi:TRAP transporter 4TM/12TM fusion protein